MPYFLPASAASKDRRLTLTNRASEGTRWERSISARVALPASTHYARFTIPEPSDW